MAGLAAGVLAFVDGVLAERGEEGGTFAYAGDSVGGAVGLQLLLDHPDRVRAAALRLHGCAARRRASWRERADLVQPGRARR